MGEHDNSDRHANRVRELTASPYRCGCGGLEGEIADAREAGGYDRDEPVDLSQLIGGLVTEAAALRRELAELNVVKKLLEHQIKLLTPTNPPPSGGHGDVWADLIAAMGPDHPMRTEMERRREVGFARYGQPLRYQDGRDNAVDLREELLDAAAYAWRDGPRHLSVVLLEAAANPSLWSSQYVRTQERALNADTYTAHAHQAERETEALLDYLSGAWRDCDHGESGGAPGCPTCEGRWSAEVRAAVQAHRNQWTAHENWAEQFKADRALAAVAEALVARVGPPLDASLPLAVRLAWVGGRTDGVGG